MPDVFTTFASSRFVDRKAVLAALRTCARRLKEDRDQVVAVHLFGSYANGTATPRSDADIVVEIQDDGESLRRQIEDAARDAFSHAPVPVDLFVLSARQLAEPRGVRAAAQRGIKLA